MKKFTLIAIHQFPDGKKVVQCADPVVKKEIEKRIEWKTSQTK